MSRRIYLVNERDELVGMQESPYDSEALLQQLIAKYPDLLTGDQGPSDGSETRWLLVTREMGVPGEAEGSNRWSLDHLFLDNDGVPTLVEVKRSSDTRIRREVVGQMLDYAANAVAYWPLERIQQRFEARCEEDGADPDDELTALLGPEAQTSDFWTAVKTNLQAGRVRLVFVADTIPPELRRVVEFLNEQMDPAEVFALEVAQFVGKGMRTLVPRVLGQTETARQKKASTESTRGAISEAEYLASFDDAEDPRVRKAAEKILAHARSLGMIDNFMRGKLVLAFLPSIERDGHLFYPFSIRRARAVFQGKYLDGWPPFDTPSVLGELRQRLERIPGVKITEKGVTGFPGIPWSSLVEEKPLKEFLSFMTWLVDRLRHP